MRFFLHDLADQALEQGDTQARKVHFSALQRLLKQNQEVVPAAFCDPTIRRLFVGSNVLHANPMAIWYKVAEACDFAPYAGNVVRETLVKACIRCGLLREIAEILRLIGRELTEAEARLLLERPGAQERELRNLHGFLFSRHPKIAEEAIKKATRSAERVEP